MYITLSCEIGFTCSDIDMRYAKFEIVCCTYMEGNIAFLELLDLINQFTTHLTIDYPFP